MDAEHASLTLVVALAAGVMAQSVARHLRVPGIVLLLAAGAVLGPDVLGWVEPHALGGALFLLVDLAVALILFEGGLNLEISRLRRASRPLRRLVTWGALATLAGATLAARLLLGGTWLSALLFGSLVVVTGPTVINPLMRELRLRPRVATLLEAEGVLIDPVGAILAVLVLEFALAPRADTLASGAGALLLRLGFGTALGIAAGLTLGGMLRVRWLVPEGHSNILSLAFVLVLFEGCDALVSHSGIVAVTVAGVVVGNLRTRVDRDLREFKDQLTVMLVGLLFVLLAADVRFAELRALGTGGLAVVAALILVVRPLDAWVCTVGSDFTPRERLFLGWIAPRGIVAAAIASLTATALEGRGVAGGAELRALVFLTIAVTVLLAGLTARPVAALLDLRLPEREGVAILGAQQLGLILGRVLRDAGVPVQFIDSNPHNCRVAEEAGFPVVFGNGLQERTLQRARFESVASTIGLTPNEALNGMFVRRARELFGVPRGYVALEKAESGLTRELLASHEAEVLFEGPHDVERWDVRGRHGDVAIERRVYRPPTAKGEQEASEREPVPNAERFVILKLQRGERTLLMYADLEPRPGDVATLALYAPEREAADAALVQRGWLPLEEEQQSSDDAG